MRPSRPREEREASGSDEASERRYRGRADSRLGDMYMQPRAKRSGQDGAPRPELPSVPRAIDLRMSVGRIANGGTLLLFMAFYDLSLYISDYVEFFRDPCRALCAESEVGPARCVLG